MTMWCLLVYEYMYCWVFTVLIASDCCCLYDLIRKESAFLFHSWYDYTLLQDQDDDAMLLGAQFCSDSFSSISLGAVNQGVAYSLYAR